MLVNFERRICYLANPKTASQTTALALRKNSEFWAVTDHHDPWDADYGDRDVVEMGMDKDAREDWLWRGHPTFTYFAVIRNPFDTLASWFELSKSSIRFDGIGPEWWDAFKVLHPKAFPAKGLFLYPRRRPPGRFIYLKYENLQTEIGWLAAQHRFPDPGTLPVIGATRNKRPDYRSYYDEAQREWVEEEFAFDLEAGGYSFE